MKRYLVSALAGLALLAGGAAPAMAESPAGVAANDLSGNEWLEASPSVRLSSAVVWTAESLSSDQLSIITDQQLMLLSFRVLTCMDAVYEEGSPSILSSKDVATACALNILANL